MLYCRHVRRGPYSSSITVIYRGDPIRCSVDMYREGPTYAPLRSYTERTPIRCSVALYREGEKDLHKLHYVYIQR
jgi:hypothetical protein